MKPPRNLIAVCAASVLVFALKATNVATTDSVPTVLRPLVVKGQRPLKEAGVEKTVFDSLALRESTALSMADILTYNSSLYVKNYGRATLSTVSFRGTSPSHTQVTWNGMRINSPMLGMTDFSTIPSYFIDKASLLHGSSAVSETGGALGGMVQLGSSPLVLPSEKSSTCPLSLNYIQGAGSFRTFDEFGRVSWNDSLVSASLRVAYSSSPNDYKYVNRDKKENIYDDNHNIIGQYYPVEKNKSGSFKDFNIMGQAYFNLGKHDKLGFDAWFLDSNRELPLTTTDYSDERQFDNRQREQTLRAVVSWNHYSPAWTLAANGGYARTNMKYDYKREITENNWSVMTRSRSRVNTLYGRAEATWYASAKWLLTANASLHQHFVYSHDKNIILVDGGQAIVGYDKARLELSGALSAKWQPVKEVGLSVVLRQEMFGDKTAFIPAFLTDALVCKPLNLTLKASVSRNHKFPSLNDLYFLPGGNPDLRDESGITYDAGASVSRQFNIASTAWLVNLSANWFDSYITDWIIWLPTTKGFFSPRNVKDVHAYGVETRLGIDILPHPDWSVSFNGTYSWTPSINNGQPVSAADKSVGRQLPYVPRNSASFTGRLTWRSWSLLYKWAFYSKRYTMSSGDVSLSGILPDYFMNNLVLQKDLRFQPLDVQLKLAVNNLFNEEYLSVLAHPMPGINFEFFLSVTPRW